MTVLFADLKASMELIADRDPEEARKLLDPVLELMMEAVHHYEGTVNRVMGDGIMALFGAPLAQEDHALRACYAALRMQERIKRHAEAVFTAADVNIQIRVGVNSGEVLVRAITNDLQIDYDAIGRTAHLAARMEQLARPGSILLSPSTLALALGFVAVKALGAVPVKGLPGTVEVYELIGVGPAQTRFQAAAHRGLTRFVGREAELEQLLAALQLAGEGHGQVVGIVAEAGVGKSRLVHELAHADRSASWLVLECGAVSFGTAMSWLPVVSLLKSFFAIMDRDSVEAISDKVAGKLATLDHVNEDDLFALLALLDMPVKDPAWQALEPAQRRRHMLDAMHRLLLATARQQPLILIFEDLHWIDGESQALLDGLIGDVGSARILLLATFRPEYRHDWSGKPHYREISLESLPLDGARKLLDAVLGQDSALMSLKQRLADLGKPFYLEEAVRTLVETQALVGSPGHYRLARPVESIEVPATVQVTLAARIDRLPLQEKQLLQVASVIGKDVPFALLRAIAGLPDEALRAGLAHLQSGEFIYPTGPPLGDPDYTFKHALTHDVAYGSLLQDRRRDLHGRIVDAIETLHHNRLDAHIERLAYHALRGELRKKAVAYLHQAGLRAGVRSAREDAVAWLQQALGVVDSLPKTPSVLETAIDIRLELRHMLAQLGELGSCVQHLHEANVLADELNDDRRRGQIYAYLANMHSMFGAPDEALEFGDRALEVAARRGDLQLRFLTTIYLQQAHFFLGNHHRVIELARDSMTLLPSGSELEHFGAAIPVAVYARCWLVRSLAELGQFAEAARHEVEMFRLAGLEPHCFTIGQAYYYAAAFRILKGDWWTAHQQLERSLEAYRTGNIFLQIPQTASHIALSRAALGEVDEALIRQQEAERLLQVQETMGSKHALEHGYRSLSRTDLLLGRPDEAQRLADHAVRFSDPALWGAAHTLQLLGDIAIHPGRFDADAAEIHYRKALAIAEPRGLRPVVAHCNLGLGQLYRSTGERSAMCEHLTIAKGMYRDMDMRFYLQRAEAELER